MTLDLPIFDLTGELDWKQEGAFDGADGRAVRAYDDVEFLRDAAVENDPNTIYPVKAGETGTVLMFVPGPDGLAQIELESRPSVVLAYEQLSFLRLHMTNEEKYPR